MSDTESIKYVSYDYCEQNLYTCILEYFLTVYNNFTADNFCIKTIFCLSLLKVVIDIVLRNATNAIFIFDLKTDAEET